MELCSIASGSSGNCIYAGTDHCHVLVDAGISGKRIEAGLNEIGLKTAEMDGFLQRMSILITSKVLEFWQGNMDFPCMPHREPLMP